MPAVASPAKLGHGHVSPEEVAEKDLDLVELVLPFETVACSIQDLLAQDIVETAGEIAFEVVPRVPVGP